ARSRFCTKSRLIKRVKTLNPRKKPKANKKPYHKIGRPSKGRRNGNISRGGSHTIKANMFKISIYSPGKNQESWLETALQTYEKRLTPYAEIHWHFVKDDTHLETVLSKQPSYLALDPQGIQVTSITFSHLLMCEVEKRGSRLH